MVFVQVYLLNVEWSDGTKCRVFRNYGAFFDFQVQVTLAAVYTTDLL